MNVLDPKAILAGNARRGVPAGAIVALSISSVCLAIFLGIMLLFGGGSFFIVFLLAMVTLVPLTVGVLALDRVEPEPRHLLLLSFLWGAGVSVVLSLVFELLGATILSAPFFGEEDFITITILAPIIEEVTKALVLFGLFWFRRHEINGITDGVVYAALTALGFAAAENIGYYLIAMSEGMLVPVFVVRGIISPLVHPICTAMTGIGIALAAQKRPGAPRILLPLGGLALAIFMHAVWNGAVFIGVGALLIVLLIQIAIMVVILLVIRRERKTTVSRIQSCMAQYLSTNLVTTADLVMLSSLKHRKFARNWARSNRGKQGFQAMRDYQLACTKLSLLHDRAFRGQISAWNFEIHRNNLLVLMMYARDAFLGPTPTFQPLQPPVGQPFTPTFQPLQPPVGQPFAPTFQPLQPPVGQPFAPIFQPLQPPVGQPFTPVFQPLQPPVGQPFTPVFQPLQPPVGQPGQPVGLPHAQPSFEGQPMIPHSLFCPVKLVEGTSG